MNYKIIILILVIGVGIFYLVQTIKRTYHENITLNLNTLYQRLNFVERKVQHMDTEVSKIVGTIGFHDLFNKVEAHAISDILGPNDVKYEPDGDVSDNEYQDETLDDDTHVPSDIMAHLASFCVGGGPIQTSNITEVKECEECDESPGDVVQLVEQKHPEEPTEPSGPTGPTGQTGPTGESKEPTNITEDSTDTSKELNDGRCTFTFTYAKGKRRCKKPATKNGRCATHLLK